MESSSKFIGAVVTTAKERTAGSGRMKSNDDHKFKENFDPNICIHRPELHNSPLMAKTQGLTNSNLNRFIYPSANREVRERKFVIAKKKRRMESDSSAAVVDSEECEKAAGNTKCLCEACESSRDVEFMNNQIRSQKEVAFDSVSECDKSRIDDEGVKERSDVLVESNCENAELRLKRRREMLLEEARESVPEVGVGRVMHLVKAFEKLLMMPKSGDFDERELKEKNKVIKWALPEMEQAPKVSQNQISSSSSDFHQTPESLHLDSRLSISSDGSQKRSLSSRTSAGGKRSRLSSSESTRTFSRRQLKTKQQKAVSQSPFMLTTEQRGRYKEEELMKRFEYKLEEEEKLRIPVALGLPITTDEPEILVKPPVKECTRPVNSVLHTNTRAVKRAEFDHQVAKKGNLIKQYRMELERQRRLSEEEEIRRLRKELVFKARPMPRFDRPFVPRRSVKHPTIPKDPKFHSPQRKKMKCCMSSDGFHTPLERNTDLS